jgi:hypothetical protein
MTTRGPWCASCAARWGWGSAREAGPAPRLARGRGGRGRPTRLALSVSKDTQPAGDRPESRGPSGSNARGVRRLAGCSATGWPWRRAGRGVPRPRVDADGAGVTSRGRYRPRWGRVRRRRWSWLGNWVSGAPGRAAPVARGPRVRGARPGVARLRPSGFGEGRAVAGRHHAPLAVLAGDRPGPGSAATRLRANRPLTCHPDMGGTFLDAARLARGRPGVVVTPARVHGVATGVPAFNQTSLLAAAARDRTGVPRPGVPVRRTAVVVA